MARAAAILIVAVCAFLATACTAGHPGQVRTGAATSASATIPSARASVAAGPPPVRGAAYTSGGCGATPPAPGTRSELGVLRESSGHPICAR